VKKLSKTISKVELVKFLKQNSDWSVNSKNTQISNTISFKNHVSALVFIARVIVHAEVLNHHPDITFTYQKVKIVITTHSLKGLSKLDLELAKRIDALKK
jgi:4a-hydroxytetrahydrobiopterin dehydratase